MTPSGVRRVERIMDVFKGSSKFRKAALEEALDEEDECPGSPSLMSIDRSFFNQTGDLDDTETSLNQTNDSMAS